MPDAPPRYLYVENDGLVYLVRGRDGRLSLPRRDDVPFAVEVRCSFNFPDADVEFATPVSRELPHGWTHKDEVDALADVDALVRRAINATLVREVVGALVVDGPPPAPSRGRGVLAPARILMVKASRGFTKGWWNMPGGFLQYGETPEEGLVREVEEEVGLEVEVEALLGVYTARFASPYFMRAHVYRCRAGDPNGMTIDPSEIAEAKWMPIAEAYEATRNPFTRAGLEKLGLAPDHRDGFKS